MAARTAILVIQGLDPLRPVGRLERVLGLTPCLRALGWTFTLTVTPGANGSAVVTWADPTTHETAYAVEQSADGGATWTVAASLGADGTPATITGLTRGATYVFRVVASNASSTATSASVTHGVLAAPTGLAGAVLFGPKVVLTWADTELETGYLVEESADGGLTWSAAAGGSALAADTTTLTVPATAGTTVQFRVTALRGADAAAGGPISVTVVAAPSDLTARVRTNPLRVTLSWTDLAPNETGYVIQRSADAGQTWTQVGTRSAVNGTGTLVSWTDGTVAQGSLYQYRVQVISGANVATSNTAAADTRPPAMPTGVVGTATWNLLMGRNELLAATWTDAAVNETGYTVQWSSNGSTVTGSTNLAANSTSWSRRITRADWWVRVGASNVVGTTWSSWQRVPAPAALRLR